VALIGVFLILLGYAHSMLVALPIYFVLGMVSVAIFNTVNTLFQTLAPERLRGRVISMHNWALGGLGFIGAILLGTLAGRTSLPFAIQCGGVIVLATAGYLWLSRSVLEGV
jgi:hypothetical protein